MIKFLFALMFLVLSVRSEAGVVNSNEPHSCPPKEARGELFDHGENFSLVAPTLDVSFSLMKSDVKTHKVVNVQCPYWIYRIEGGVAAQLLHKVLSAGAIEGAEPLDIKLLFDDPKNGVVYAEGMTCRWGRYAHFGKDFSCIWHVYGDEGLEVRSTEAGPVALPKPRMGAGNASVVLREMAPVFSEHL